MNLIHQIRDQIKAFSRSLYLPTLTKYLFVPMYGYNDIWSRLISFSVRLVQLVIILVMTVLYIVGRCILLVVWLCVPIVVVGNIVYQLGGLLWQNLL
ncbi:MAG TPA: hypothetical protein DEG44_00235 [Candidatus Kerfeldbacteria bacterium]|nr:hypothetical protein [Candidatus Kerfeldbacteria bacterium]